MGKRLTVDELEPIARAATRLALQGHEAAFAPFRDHPDLTLGTFIADDELVFQLYIAREKRTDALMLVSTKVSRITGDVLGVEFHIESSQ